MTASKPEFEREERYMVVKLSKLRPARNDEMKASECVYRAARFGKALVKAVVVEEDWPEYELVWQMLEARMTGQPTPLEAARAADKARIAELEAAIKDPETVFLNMKRGAIATPSVRLWSKLFGEVLNDDDARLIEIARLRERLAELETALRNIAAEVDGNIRECVRDCVNQRGNVQDIYDYCDRIDATVDAALAQQGKEGET